MALWETSSAKLNLTKQILSDRKTFNFYPMHLSMVILFILGYSAIAFEHVVKINKTASALITGVLLWVIYVMGGTDTNLVSTQLYEHFGQISSILFFLLSAMTIVELI